MVTIAGLGVALSVRQVVASGCARFQAFDRRRPRRDPDRARPREVARRLPPGSTADARRPGPGGGILARPREQDMAKRGEACPTTRTRWR